MASPLAVAAAGARAATRAVTKKEEKKPAPISQAIRQAGVGGITKQELNQITKDSGKSAGTVVQRLDQINKNLKANDKTGISLNSGAANMLIRQAGKQSPTGYNAYLNMLSGGSTFGSGRIGSVLQARASGTDLMGKQGNLMIGGTSIRPGGREAVQGFGKQYELQKTVIKNPIDLDTGRTKPTTTTDPVSQEPVVQEPVVQDPASTPTDPGPGMLSGGGMGAAGANKLGRAKSRLRQLGITGKGSGLLGRNLLYGNALNV